MLSKADDFPIHQNPEPIAYAGVSRNFYDRYFFNGYHLEEVGNTLELHIQQWDKGYKSRGPAQKMRLSAIEEKSVTFTAASPGTLKKLGYALVDEDKEFQIRITTADDQDMVLKLAPKS